MNADILIDFMMRLVNKSERKIYLVLDNLRVHHSGPVKEWLECHKHMIQVFYLPAYSSEPNPDEYLNCDLKKGVHSGVPARNKEQLKQKTRSHMHRVEIFDQDKLTLGNSSELWVTERQKLNS